MRLNNSNRKSWSLMDRKTDHAVSLRPFPLFFLVFLFGYDLQLNMKNFGVS